MLSYLFIYYYVFFKLERLNPFIHKLMLPLKVAVVVGL